MRHGASLPALGRITQSCAPPDLSEPPDSDPSSARRLANAAAVGSRAPGAQGLGCSNPQPSPRRAAVHLHRLRRLRLVPFEHRQPELLHFRHCCRHLHRHRLPAIRGHGRRQLHSVRRSVGQLHSHVVSPHPRFLGRVACEHSFNRLSAVAHNCPLPSQLAQCAGQPQLLQLQRHLFGRKPDLSCQQCAASLGSRPERCVLPQSAAGRTLANGCPAA